MTSYLVVPRDVSDRSADVWLATVDEPAVPTVLTSDRDAKSVALDPRGWKAWQFGGRVIRHRVVTIGGLNARTRYRVELRAGQSAVAKGAVTTLPARLPAAGEPPFTVLLGSCFCRKKDDAGDVGRTFFHLPPGAAPDLKILCGDQVYLDSPWYRFAWPHPIAKLQSLFVENYVATWTQDSGFRELLADGANYFMSDDHEFWNNAPTAGTYAVDTWTKTKRDAWWNSARELYRVFQSPGSTARFDIPPLSVFLIDTRLARDVQRRKVVTNAVLQQLRNWIAALRAPGVLVVGQPIFDVQHGFKGRFFDWGLADYDQYGELVRALATTQHSIVVLTGDVHYGRVALCSLWSGGELIEVISSPLALVDDSAGGSWSPAPETFPSFDVPEAVKAPIATQTRLKRFSNLFLTLEFNARDAVAIELSVKFWPIVTGGATPHDTVVFQRTLH